MGARTIFLIVVAIGKSVMGVNARQGTTLHRAELCAAIVAAVAAETTLLAVAAIGSAIMRMDAGQGAICDRAGGIDRPLLYRYRAMVSMCCGRDSDGREYKDTRDTR